jgi:hypothetical protein
VVRAVLASACLALLAAPATAQAHDGWHGDRIPEGADAAMRQIVAQGALARVATPRVGGPQLADSWCGTPTATDRPGLGPAIKVVYVHASDDPDRFAQFADLIQSDARLVTDSVLLASGGARSVRFDVGTACGANYLDVATIALPGTRATYAALPLQRRLERVHSEVVAALGPSVTPRNVLIYGDELAVEEGVTGVAMRPSDDRPGPDNSANRGGFAGLVLGDGTAEFGTSHQTTAEHELLHTLGAVQDSAPHATGLGHCWQGVDVLCYPDGSGKELVLSCPDAAPTTIDCGSDDYFSPAPAPGSYLAQHWNVNDSVFLCAPAQCMDPSGNLSPVASFAATPNGLTVHLDATASVDPEGPIAAYAWDVDGDGNADATGAVIDHTFPRAGVYGIRLTVTDTSGATAKASRALTVTAPPAAPAPPRVIASSADLDSALRIAQKRLRRAVRRAGGVRGLARGKRVRVRVELPAKGRVAAQLRARRRNLAKARAHTAPGRRVTLTLKLNRRARAEVRRTRRVQARLAFRRL